MSERSQLYQKTNKSYPPLTFSSNSVPHKTFQKRSGIILCFQLTFEEYLQMISNKTDKVIRKTTIYKTFI